MQRETDQAAPWFAYRTDVTLRGVARPRPWVRWLVVGLAATACAGLALAALLWLVTLDLDALPHFFLILQQTG